MQQKVMTQCSMHPAILHTIDGGGAVTIAIMSSHLRTVTKSLTLAYKMVLCTLNTYTLPKTLTSDTVACADLAGSCPQPNDATSK